MRVLLATGLEELDRGIAAQLAKRDEFELAGECYYREGLMLLLRERGADAVVLSPHLPGQVKVSELVRELRLAGVRVVLLPGGREDKEAVELAQYAVALGVYDIVWDPVKPQKVVWRLENPAGLKDAGVEPDVAVVEYDPPPAPVREDRREKASFWRRLLPLGRGKREERDSPAGELPEGDYIAGEARVFPDSSLQGEDFSWYEGAAWGAPGVRGAGQEGPGVLQGPAPAGQVQGTERRDAGTFWGREPAQAAAQVREGAPLPGEAEEHARTPRGAGQEEEQVPVLPEAGEGFWYEAWPGGGDTPAPGGIGREPAPAVELKGQESVVEGPVSGETEPAVRELVPEAEEPAAPGGQEEKAPERIPAVQNTTGREVPAGKVEDAPAFARGHESVARLPQEAPAAAAPAAQAAGREAGPGGVLRPAGHGPVRVRETAFRSRAGRVVAVVAFGKKAHELVLRLAKKLAPVALVDCDLKEGGLSASLGVYSRDWRKGDEPLRRDGVTLYPVIPGRAARLPEGALRRVLREARISAPHLVVHLGRGTDTWYAREVLKQADLLLWVLDNDPSALDGVAEAWALRPRVPCREVLILHGGGPLRPETLEEALVLPCFTDLGPVLEVLRGDLSSGVRVLAVGFGRAPAVAGAVVDAFDDAEQALAWARANPPDLAVVREDARDRVHLERGLKEMGVPVLAARPKELPEALKTAVQELEGEGVRA
ncbi:hypothetical protein [Ammonifex thiophilus]|uniref:Uncharacterized protein n=1 Tax=Ammonifex thiophilus TaxID=444093 RepID=A0A3D8P3M8_9THEO|nr:hypothetical protein [Ammonifex thiophilus]RDV81236.1 hypothetical protein DXX99_09640 [Ammonifex thiophilus]